MFDFSSLTFSAVPIMLIVFGLVEFFKDAFDLEGKKVTALSMILGVLCVVAVQVAPVLPPQYSQVLGYVFNGLAGGLSASGYYKAIKKFTAKEEDFEYPQAEKKAPPISG